MSESQPKEQSKADPDVYEENLGCEGRAAWLAAIVVLLLLAFTLAVAAQDVSCPRPAPYKVMLPLVQNQSEPDAWCMSIGCTK